MEQDKQPSYTVKTKYSTGLNTCNEVQGVNHIEAVNAALRLDRHIYPQELAGCTGAEHKVFLGQEPILPDVESIFN